MQETIRVFLAAVLMLGILAVVPEAKADPCVKLINNTYNCGNGCLRQVPQCGDVPNIKSCTFWGFLSCCGNGSLLIYMPPISVQLTRAVRHARPRGCL
jgi:hypothetical protein